MSKKYKVFFKHNAHYHTQSVEVIGDFNNWEPGNIFLEDEDGDNEWWGSTELPDGVYRYKFLVDGKEYRTDDRNPLKEADEDGNENSVLKVGTARRTGDILHEPDQDLDFYCSDCFYVRARINSDRYSGARLILVVDDFIKTVGGFEVFTDEAYRYLFFKVENGFSPKKLLYYFEADLQNGEHEYFGTNGIVLSEWEVDNFDFIRPEHLSFSTPDWVKDAVFYQIFPERFAVGNPKISPENSLAPEILPQVDSFYGGDLDGVMDNVKHFKDLGINAIYFNPIFDADTNHKYDANDYKKIDPHFGDDKTFDKLQKILHKNGINFILDGVFNHTGPNFWAFKDIDEKGRDSEYFDWYFVKDLPLRGPNGEINYECWWNFPQHPKLNTDNPECRAHLLDVASYWIKRGADGWRLDVPNEVDHPFWKEFRNEVKSANPEAYIVGEIWQNGADWLQGDEFDAVMNYLFRQACIAFFAQQKIDGAEFVKLIGNQIFSYSMAVNLSLLNLLSSHDTARFFTVTHGDFSRIKLALAFQFTYVGAPSIYYGEEIGMEGGKDPDNRRFMQWNKKKWNKDLYKTYKRLIAVRTENEVLRRGEIRFFFVEGDAIGFERFIGEERLYILINNGNENVSIDLTQYAGNGDFSDLFMDYPLKRKRAYTLYANDFVILKKIKER